MYVENPYKTHVPFFGNILQMASEEDKLVAMADRVVEKGGDLFKNEEKRIEMVGIAARILDWGVCFIVGGMEGVLFADKVIKPFHVSNFPILCTFPLLLSTVTLPTAGFFLGIAAFEGLIEFLQLRRSTSFLASIEKRKKDPIKAMQWVKKKYFTLSTEESQKIYKYLEKSAPDLPRKMKAERFDEIAEKALKVKFDTLKRRVSAGVAEEVRAQLDVIEQGARSFRPSKRTDAFNRAEILVQSLSKQAKNRILIHVIAILALACTIVSMSVFLAGVAGGPFFMIMGATAVSLLVLSLLMNKGIFSKEGERIYDKLANEQVTGHSSDRPCLQEAP